MKMIRKLIGEVRMRIGIRVKMIKRVMRIKVNENKMVMKRMVMREEKVDVKMGVLLENPGVVKLDLTPPPKLVEVKLS